MTPHLQMQTKRRMNLLQTFLTSPNARVNDFEEELPRSWIEDEDGTVYESLERASRGLEDSLMGFVVKLPSKVLWLERKVRKITGMLSPKRTW